MVTECVLPLISALAARSSSSRPPSPSLPVSRSPVRTPLTSTPPSPRSSQVTLFIIIVAFIVVAIVALSDANYTDTFITYYHCYLNYSLQLRVSLPLRLVVLLTLLLF